MHTIVWEFVVRPGREAEFERLYGMDGEWARLFRRGEGFFGTELVISAGAPDGQRYLTLDRWRAPGDFERFTAQHREAYDAIDARCEALTLRERRLAAFDAAPDDAGHAPASADSGGPGVAHGRDTAGGVGPSGEHASGAATGALPSGVTIRRATAADLPAWSAMRHALWPDCPEAIHAHECALLLRHPDAGSVLLAADPAGLPAGFIECSVRRYAEGCHSGRIGYVEGWYVREDLRRRGVGRALLAAGEDWARGIGCLEMASDTQLSNTVSQAAHARAGYLETERAVTYRKALVAGET
jgi:aminoglycoside 6'-N-acetyltransferase I